jgi:peptidyl-tRNA hydrolase, PTH1 family
MTSTPPKPIIGIAIGLGNPGPEYADTYHNVGLLFIDYLVSDSRPKSFGLLKSSTFMNESGRFVKKAIEKYGAKPAEILVAHDESDLPLGTFKLSFNRSSAGHKGAQSVMDALGTREFWRLRIGIRPQEAGNPVAAEALVGKRASRAKSQKSRRVKAGDFVLKKIGKKDSEKFLVVFEKIAGELLG